MSSSLLRLAAAALPLRPGASGFEVLMVKRNEDLSFGGMWTFPGGGLEPADGRFPATIAEDMQNWSDGELLQAARAAAARETHEESGLVCDISSMSLFSHWIPPTHIAPKRFATWFFLAPDVVGELEVDTSENSEARWIGPSEALGLYHDGHFPVAAPTWVTLDDLRQYDSVGSLQAEAAERGPRLHHTKAIRHPDGVTLLWAGDASYDSDELVDDEPHNRVLMSSNGLILERRLS